MVISRNKINSIEAELYKYNESNFLSCIEGIDYIFNALELKNMSFNSLKHYISKTSDNNQFSLKDFLNTSVKTFRVIEDCSKNYKILHIKYKNDNIKKISFMKTGGDLEGAIKIWNNIKNGGNKYGYIKNYENTYILMDIFPNEDGDNYYFGPEDEINKIQEEYKIKLKNSKYK